MGDTKRVWISHSNELCKIYRSWDLLSVMNTDINFHPPPLRSRYLSEYDLRAVGRSYDHRRPVVNVLRR